MPTTDEWWSINGASLHEYGWNVTTVGGSRYDLPPRRGSNITLAKRPGQMHRDKMADARTIELIMWCQGVEPYTGEQTGYPLLRWNDSWDYLRRMVWMPTGEEVFLARQWYLTVDRTKTLVQATGMAEITNSMAPTMTGRFRADFTMQLLMADPYFYGAEQTITFNPGDTKTVTNPGHDIAALGCQFSPVEIDFVGPLAPGARLTNTAFTPAVWVESTLNIPAGVTVRASIRDFTFRTVVGYHITGIINFTNNIRHAGARFWQGLYPGDNTLSFTASGGGHIELRFRPPYI